jgi:hypothetical protein
MLKFLSTPLISTFWVGKSPTVGAFQIKAPSTSPILYFGNAPCTWALHGVKRKLKHAAKVTMDLICSVAGFNNAHILEMGYLEIMPER